MTGSNDSRNSHFHLKLVDANGLDLLVNDWDGSPFPGTAMKRDFTPLTTPNSKSFAGLDTFVSVSNISDAGRAMKMRVSVSQGRTSRL